MRGGTKQSLNYLDNHAIHQKQILQPQNMVLVGQRCFEKQPAEFKKVANLKAVERG